MQRYIFATILLLIASGAIFLIYLKFKLPPQDSVVYLKESPNSSISGYVTEKDNYIIVEKDGSEQLIPWSEIKSISGPNPLASETSSFTYWLDKVDFLSSLGILATLIVFSVGLYQYQQGNLWKREEFLAGQIKNFSEAPRARNAKQMLDALAQNYETVEIELYPEKENDHSEIKLNKKDIIESLAVPIQKRDDIQMQRIRESFDDFFNHLESFEHYVRLNVVSKKSVYVQIGYWIDLLGRQDRLNKNYRGKINGYASHFQYTGYLKLLNRYNKKHRCWLFIKNFIYGEENVENLIDTEQETGAKVNKTEKTDIKEFEFKKFLVKKFSIGKKHVKEINIENVYLKETKLNEKKDDET